MTKDVQQQLNILKEGIKIDAPLVADFFDTQTPLGQYSRSLYEYKAAPQHRERQAELKKVVRSLLLQIFSKEEIKKGNIDWDTDWKTNIVDHQGLLSHPLLVATNIIGNMHQLPSKTPQGIVVLSDSGVPMNNFFHKRGMIFAGQQINLHPNKFRHTIAYIREKLEKFNLAQDKLDLSKEQLRFLRRMDDQLNNWSQDKRLHDYSDQVTRINYHLWKELFEPDLRDQIPDLFYISNEKVAAELLKLYLKDKDHLFYKVLFEKNTRDLIIRNFTDLTGCWDKDGKRGSKFFWGLDKNGGAVSLSIEGEQLVGKGISMPLTPKGILKALEEKKIYPGMFLVYGISIFFCGIRPLVGYGSMNYQTTMKEAWSKTMKDINPEEVQLIEHIPTDGFIGGPKVTFAYENNAFIDLFALDIIYRGSISREYLEHLRDMPFNAVLTPALIDIYDSYVRPERKQPITITSNQLMGQSFGWLKKMGAK